MPWPAPVDLDVSRGDQQGKSSSSQRRQRSEVKDIYPIPGDISDLSPRAHLLLAALLLLEEILPAVCASDHAGRASHGDLRDPVCIRGTDKLNLNLTTLIKLTSSVYTRCYLCHSHAAKNMPRMDAPGMRMIGMMSGIAISTNL